MKQVILLIAFSLLAAVYGFSQADMQPAAIVNLIRTEQITVRQLRGEVELMERAAGRPLNQSERLQVLDVMINERLVLQAAERDRSIAGAAGIQLTVTENELNEQMQQFRNELAGQIGRPPTEAEFAEAVRNASGRDLPAFRENLRRQLIVQRYMMFRMGDRFASLAPPTEEEIVTHFNLNRREFTRPETVEFDGIQVPFGRDAASRANARQVADRLVRDIGTDPSRFDSMHERARLPNSGFNSFSREQVPRLPQAQAAFGQNFMNTAFNLRQGQVSGLIETNNEYLIIKVTRRLEFRNLELDDIMPGFMLASVGIDPRNTMTVRNFLALGMASERQQMAIMQATQDLTSELRAGRGTVRIFEERLNW